MTTKYLLIFTALAIFGATADVPVMFLAVQGTIPLSFVIIVGFFTDLCSDMLWYWIGSKIGTERFFRLRFFHQNPARVEKLSRAVDRYGNVALFSSKFVYGAGIPTQIIAGAHRYNFKKFLTTNTLGAAGWIIALYFLAIGVRSATDAQTFLRDAKIAFLVFIVVVFVLNYILNRWLKKLFK